MCTAVRVVISQIVVVLRLLRGRLVQYRAVVTQATDLSFQLLILLDLVLLLQRWIHVGLDVLLAVAPGLEDLSLVLLRLGAVEGVQLAQVLRVASRHAKNVVLVEFLARLGVEGLLLL